MKSDKKIIIVEDEMVIAMDLISSLESYGYQIVGHVTSGEDVFKAIEKSLPDIILMDIKLEGQIDGIDVAQIINENYNIPVIFLTSYSNRNLIDRAKKTNPFGYIVKPFEDRELFTNIEIAVFKHDTEVKLRESEKKYRELSESIQQIIIECDLTGKITYINQPGMQLLGLSYSEISSGVSLASFFDPVEFQKIKERIINHYDSNSQNVNREYRLVNKLGKHYFIEEYLSPIYQEEKVGGFRGILIDITSKKLKEHLNILFNKLSFRYNTCNVDPIVLMKHILQEFEKQFGHFEDIYFNEYDEKDKSFYKHQNNELAKRPLHKGFSEHVILTNKPLYLRGQELSRFIQEHQVPPIGPKTACWSGFPVRFQGKVLGVFALKSVTNENALTLSEFDNLIVFFDNINSLFERISYLKEIKQSEEQYKLLVNSINEGIIQFNLAGHILFANQQISNMTGYSREELLNMSISELLGPNSRSENFLRKLQVPNKKISTNRYELNIRGKDGKIKEFLVSDSPVKNSAGEVLASMATLIDISEKKEHLKLIKESEQVFSDMAKNVPGVIFQYRLREDGSVYFSYLSEKITELFGIELPQNPSREDLAQRIPEEEQEEFFDSLDRSIKDLSEWKYEGRIICGNGEIKWFEGKSKPMLIADQYVFNGILINTTRRRQAIQAILNSEKEKERILHSIPDSFLVVDEAGTILNSYFKKNEKVIGSNTLNPIGSNIETSLNPIISVSIQANLKACLQKEKIIFEEVEINAGKTKFWFEMRTVPFSENSVLVILRNVTEIKNNILALQKFFNITEQSNELIMITDYKGKIEYVNPTFIRTTGHELIQIKGKSPSFFKSAKHSKAFYQRMWDTILAGQVFTAEFYNTKRNGEIYIEAKTISPLINEMGDITHFISTGRDVTEEKKREKKILTYQKFEKTLEKKEQKYRTLSLIQGQENERIRIAREIHDGLGQMLTVAKANLESLDESNMSNLENISKVELVNQIVSEIIQESRRISHNLSPVGLYEFGLHAILVQFVNRTNSNFDTPLLHFSSNIAKLRFKNEIEINLYRIAQEVVQNSLKHSHASKITLNLHLENNSLNMEIKDNGVGFNIKQLENDTKHFNGIKNIQERVKIIDGKLTFSAQKKAGVTVLISLKAKIIDHDKNIFS